MGNPIVHFEIMGADGPALEKFYAELFGWHVQSMPEMNYGIVDTHAGGGINGGIGATPDGNALVIVYAEVDDPQATLDKAVSLGATVAMEVMAIPGAVTLAQFTDPQGNRIGLVQSDPGGESPGVSPGDGVGVTWFEILGTDGLALHAFYGELFGWTFPIVNAEMGNYGHVDTNAGGRGIPGAVGTSHDKPVVRVYATVDDLAKYIERAESLGATVELAPTKVSEETEIAAFRDPQGNPFGLVKGM
jgi:uncharacterized protein